MPEFRARVAALAWPVSGLLFLLLLWQVVTQAGIVPGFLLPSPGAVLRALLRAAGEGTL